jgi:hypothetical protein
MRYFDFIWFAILSLGALFVAKPVVRKSWSKTRKLIFSILVGASLYFLSAFIFVATKERPEDHLARWVFCRLLHMDTLEACKPVVVSGSTDIPSNEFSSNRNGKKSDSHDRQPEKRVEEDCDRLAASAEDPRRPDGVTGVRISEIDPTRAISACERAMQLQPSVARFAFQAGRAAAAGHDFVRAYQHYQAAANLGHELAMYNLGQLYALGKGVPQNFIRARQWYDRAGALGATQALNQIGVFYSRGEGVNQDFSQARHWFEKAAALGNQEAMTNLGFVYLEGYGVKQDAAEARKWFELAAKLGEPTAKKKLQDLR